MQQLFQQQHVFVLIVAEKEWAFTAGLAALTLLNWM